MSVATQIHLNKFKVRPYQFKFANAFENKTHRKYLCVWPRRSGKDFTLFNLVLRAAIRNVGSYFYCLPTHRQARLVIWESITNDGIKFLDCIPKELIKRQNNVDMVVELVNGSIIRLVGSDNFDTNLVGTNTKMIIFSEFALADARAYKLALPIINANNGLIAICSCVAPNTIVLTEDGPREIADLSPMRNEYNPFNENIFGLGGFNLATDFYYGGKQKTLVITLSSGYKLECTHNHPIWTGNKWKKASEWKVGDLLPIQYDQQCFGKGFDISNDIYYDGKSVCKFDLKSLDFFYLLGLIHADGNYDKSTVCVTKKKDPEIIAFLHKYGFKTRSDGMHHEYSNRMFIHVLEVMGFKHGAKNKVFPKCLFECNKEQLTAFLQGLFDGDGTSNSCPKKRGYVKFTTTCKSFIDTLQIVLLNFGIVSSVRTEYKKPTKRVKVYSTIYNLEIQDYFAHIFYRDIGFRLQRKQKNCQYVTERCKQGSGNAYPVDLTDMRLPSGMITNRKKVTRRMLEKLHKIRPELPIADYIKEKLYYSPIISIIDNESEIFDFVIPQTHSFFSNGFISHNTPRGHNHMYDLYQIAKNNPKEWYCEKLSIEDTQHIPIERIHADIARGEMSEELAKQEYWSSFSLGIAGTYYGSYMDKMRLEERITTVPWEPDFKVHCAFDLGVNNPTVIVFFQVIGNVIHIIDYYQNNSVGLEHYTKYLQSLDYTYGEFFVPHDIAVFESTSGMTRKERLESLGIYPYVTPKYRIEDGIEAVRSMLPRCWIDKDKCKWLIKALENYGREYDEKRNVYFDKPAKSPFNDACDAVRYMALNIKNCGDHESAEQIKERYDKITYGENSNLPSFYR